MNKLLTAAVNTIAAACLIGSAQVATADDSMPSGRVSIVGTSVVTTAHVELTPHPVYVARGYTYDLYATCWSKAGRPQRAYEKRVATGVRVPSGSGSYQLRVPSDTRTSFTFTDPVAMLASPQTGTQAVACPKRLTPGVSRAVITSSDITVTSDADGTRTVTRAEYLTAYFPAP